MNMLMPRDRPLVCINSNRNRLLYIECCDSNYCNFNVTLPYTIQFKGLRQPWSGWAFVIIILALGVGGLLAATLFCYRKKLGQKYRAYGALFLLFWCYSIATGQYTWHLFNTPGIPLVTSGMPGVLKRPSV
ncbi:hypothetical protein FHG87_000435 [Trinorchestia longiramus]|nr:hypothetical protein FHG87_000435 [Trinorchestia longiramus]